MVFVCFNSDTCVRWQLEGVKLLVPTQGGTSYGAKSVGITGSARVRCVQELSQALLWLCYSNGLQGCPVTKNKLKGL